MIAITNTAEYQLQQHTSRGNGCAVRTRMLQDCTIAKMGLGLRFTKLTPLYN